MSEPPARDPNDVKAIDEGGGEVVEHMGCVAQPGQAHQGPSASSPVQSVDRNAWSDRHHLRAVGRWIPPCTGDPPVIVLGPAGPDARPENKPPVNGDVRTHAGGGAALTSSPRGRHRRPHLPTARRPPD